MAKRKNRRRTLLWVAGAGVGAYLGYEYVYKPWAAARAGGGTAFPQPYPSFPNAALPGSMLPAPGNVTPVGWTTLGPQYGGVLGACIAKKGGTWSAEKCQARLNDLVNAARAAKARIAELKAGAANSNAPGVAAGQAAIATVQAALQNDVVQYNAALAAGDQARAAVWHAAMLSHQAELNDYTARVAAAQKPVVDAAAIAAYEGALAGHDTDYFNLTGVRLLNAI